MNEKPTHFAKKVMAHSMQRNLGKAAIIHTTYGDIHIKLFGLEAPKAVENFTTLAERGYFDNLFFHRIVKNFMIQTGDPNGKIFQLSKCCASKVLLEATALGGRLCGIRISKMNFIEV